MAYDPFAEMARSVLYATGTDCTITGGGSDVDGKAGIRFITDNYGEQSQGNELIPVVSVLNADMQPDSFQSVTVSEGENAGVYTRQKKIEGDGKISVFACVFSSLVASIFLLEDGSGGYLLEDGSGRLALE